MTEDLEKEQEESKPLETNIVEEKKREEEAREAIKVEDSEGEKRFVDKKEEIKEEAVEKKPEIIPENKEAKSPISFINEKTDSILKGKKEGSFKPFIFVMVASLAIAFFWDSIPFIKNSVHAVLDPSAGTLLSLSIPYGLEIGMLLIVLIISLFTTLVQKYATDQKALKELRKEQKILQDEMKKYKEHPEKIAELSKKQFEFIPRTFKLTSRALMFTGIPFILFFRWFHDFFANVGDPKFFGILSWLWFYLIAVMIFSSILRKLLKVV